MGIALRMIVSTRNIHKIHRLDLTTQPFIDKAILEILNPEFAVTKQYLAVNTVEFDGDLPKVERVDLEYSSDLVAVFFPIKGQKYFLEIHLNKAPVTVNFVYIESGNQIDFCAVSEKLTFEELSNFLSLQPLTGWSVGDLMKNGKMKYQFSRVAFGPIKNNAYELEEKLKLLLTEVEKDANGVRKLSENADIYVSVCRGQYVGGNAGTHLDISTIKRLANLNLTIDIDTYIGGDPLLNDED
jgi:hypothetical protein